MQANESVDGRVRRRLRDLRTERGLTLEAVATRAGVGVSTLSRLESGKRRLALDHLPGLAEALGVSTDELLRPQPEEDPRVRSRPRSFDGLTLWPLTHKGPAGGLHAFKIVISAERRVPPTDLGVHEGHDWIYVLAGGMWLRLGEQDFTVEPGETVEFSTLTPHWFGAVEGPVELIAILGPHGERMHLHDH
jgi:transcriptional regulator with XRE-family HTH domain